MLCMTDTECSSVLLFFTKQNSHSLQVNVSLSFCIIKKLHLCITSFERKHNLNMSINLKMVSGVLLVLTVFNIAQFCCFAFCIRLTGHRMYLSATSYLQKGVSKYQSMILFLLQKELYFFSLSGFYFFGSTQLF